MELRKDCPQDLSLSNSVGNAGGGGHPNRMAGISGSTFFWEFLCSSMSPSSCLNPCIKRSSCFLVSSSLAFESERACSKAVTWVSTKAEHGCRSTKVTSGYTHGNTYR